MIIRRFYAKSTAGVRVSPLQSLVANYNKKIRDGTRPSIDSIVKISQLCLWKSNITIAKQLIRSTDFFCIVPPLAFYRNMLKLGIDPMEILIATQNTGLLLDLEFFHTILSRYSNTDHVADMWKWYLIMRDFGFSPAEETWGLILAPYAMNGDLNAVKYLLRYATQPSLDLRIPELLAKNAGHLKNEFSYSDEDYNEPPKNNNATRSASSNIDSDELTSEVDSIQHLNSTQPQGQLLPDIDLLSLGSSFNSIKDKHSTIFKSTSTLRSIINFSDRKSKNLVNELTALHYFNYPKPVAISPGTNIHSQIIICLFNSKNQHTTLKYFEHLRLTTQCSARLYTVMIRGLCEVKMISDANHILMLGLQNCGTLENEAWESLIISFVNGGELTKAQKVRLLCILQLRTYI